MKRKGGIVVSRLAPAYFTEQAVLAFKEAGYDPVFCTTLSSDGHDMVARALRLAGLAQKRRLRFVDAAHLHTCPWREAARLLLGKFTRDEVITDRAFYWMRDGYDAWVARQMKPPAKMVYAAETECLETFKAAKKAGIRTVLDLPSPEHDYVEDLLYREYEKFPGLLTSGRRYLRTLQSERTARRHEEFRLADAVIANSSLTARTWAASGLDGSKIKVVTYGSPEPKANADGDGSQGEGPLRLVWAGTFSVRKGAHYLLEAWRNLNPGKSAVLDVYGSQRLPPALLQSLPDNIVFHGPVTQDELFAAFGRADLLVFPTLCDGFGLVVTESFARGLPVLTTRQAGASDLVVDKVNGIIVEAGSALSLEGAIAWALSNRLALREMRREALQTAIHCHWSKYRADLCAALKLDSL